MQAPSSTSTFHTFLDYMHLPPVPGIVVPQQAFSPPSAVVPTLREPIRFSTQENAGVNLQNAGIPSYRGLINGDQSVSLESNVLSIHIHWPGYAPMRRSIPLGNIGNRLTYKMLALMIAKTVQGWMMDVQQKNIQSSEPTSDWHLNQVKFESLWLLELRQISTGLWQPVLLRDV
ncbi:hypothetical protein BC629DRAFT_1596776 [Irpex lacteus]|nr:hypothetical protein BC629DRAFT_1596776 [Irpex lacteus]